MFRFHSVIQSNYLAVHEWLLQQEDLSDYRKNNAWTKVNKQLEEQTLESAALQYYVLFPAHSAKVAYTLEHIIGIERLANWIKYNSQVTVIDVGCGAGAASVAFINLILQMWESKQLKHPILIHFVGIDPNEYAIGLYNKQISGLQDKLQNYDINLSYKVIPERDLRAVNQLREELAQRRKGWGVPFLSHAFLLQANVVSPFSARFQRTETKYERLASLGVSVEAMGSSVEVFGKEEATAYKQILENALIDNLHIVTVGTEGYEKRVSELAEAIDSEFQGNSHIVERIGGGKCSYTYQIPDGCYWKEFKKNDNWEFDFYVEASTISNIALADEDWTNIQSTKNLHSAWARTRHHLLEQTLVDEVEIRLFEASLGANIARLQQQLRAYAQNVVHTDDRLHFKFPKGYNQLRPLGLSRIEEEILSTAIIQKLGQRISGLVSRSYAYKFSRSEQNTEYLYENWFDAYGRFIQDARLAAQNYDGCVVIQTDIKSFYTRIIRDNLVQLSTEQLSRSSRVEWLLRLLFSRDIDDHEAGQGIVQGNIASGFFANLYLVDLDARFDPSNEWNARFFRYVDDIIIVVPDPEHVKEVILTLEQELEKLGLELNSSKTDYFTDISEFISITDKDEILDSLQNRFQSWINCLWILDDQHRQSFRKSYTESQDEWWYRIELYQTCLKNIGISIDVRLLSRRVYKYLFNDRLCKKNFEWKQPFGIPLLPDSKDDLLMSDWQIKFQKRNASWIAEGVTLCNILREMLSESRTRIVDSIANEDSKSEKKWARTFRFCINKLIQFGLHHDDVAQIIFKTLKEFPWLIRNPHKLTEKLAIYDYCNFIETLLTSYNDENDPMQEYMKSIVLRAIRFLPTISDSLWQKVVTSATSSSDVISLMATESWLQIAQSHPKMVEDAHLMKIEIALSKKPKPISRVLKNYLLILGENNKKVVLTIEQEQDDQFQDVLNIVQDSRIDALFDYYEPEILTREFYSGSRSSDEDGSYPTHYRDL